jgi:hypothetical protein
MIGRRKKSFYALYELLRGVEADKGNLRRVLELNRQILREVLLAEAAILRHKEVLRRLRLELKIGRKSKDAATKLRKRMARVVGYIDGYYKQIYIWKCFGDGLAFAYLDKFAVKHAFFETKSYEVKPGAGMLTGKAGLVYELASLLSAIEHDVPAVLCDITNTLRYGDICLLGGSDPCLLEVKSSTKLNQRGKRQALSLKTLTDFLETDLAENFRGLREVRRSVVDIPERTHGEALNRCIEEAERSGYAVVRPEPDLTYIAVYGSSEPIETIIPNDLKGRQIFFMLNTEKNSGTWAIYYPFTLSIRAAKHLHDFVVGDLFLIVAFDIGALCEAMQRPGWEVIYRENALYGIQFHHLASGARIGISQQFLGRVGYEFVSPAWVAETQSSKVAEIEPRLTEHRGAVLSERELDEIRTKYFDFGHSSSPLK